MFYIHVFIYVYFYGEGVHSMAHMCRTEDNVFLLCESQGFNSGHRT